jgi:dTDP-4-amino-4,6-dideoxygalactose transaminase
MARFERRDELKKYLIENGIEAKIHYPVPLHLQKAAKDLGYKPGDFPMSETYGQEIITLPAHQFIDIDLLEYTISAIKKFYTNCLGFVDIPKMN